MECLVQFVVNVFVDIDLMLS